MTPKEKAINKIMRMSAFSSLFLQASIRNEYKYNHVGFKKWFRLNFTPEKGLYLEPHEAKAFTKYNKICNLVNFKQKRKGPPPPFARITITAI
jgi:hypothetical protein